MPITFATAVTTTLAVGLLSAAVTVAVAVTGTTIDSSDIFCRGPVLHAVQTAMLFKDSKHFVDMTMKDQPEIIYDAFLHLKNTSDIGELKDFVEKHFSEPGSELQDCIPVDWQKEPASFNFIQDMRYRLWAYDIHSKWRNLCRRVKHNVLKHEERHSLIPLPYPFVIPGGRFRECYYWDSYWIIKGLLVSGMNITAKNMIKNLAYMVNRFGFVPNGGRIYYKNRSHPPVLALAVYAYYKATGDIAFVRTLLPTIETEMKFWDRNRSVTARTESGAFLTLYHYKVDVNHPRPESYREDLETVASQEAEMSKKWLWSNIASACESGWDFSSRWLSDKEQFRLGSIETLKIVPVDLNALICGNQRILSNLYAIAGDKNKALKYRRAYKLATDAIQEAFWDASDGIWHDLNLETQRKTKDYYASNFFPLFTGCVGDTEKIGTIASAYAFQTGAADMPHGLPTSLFNSSQQWDQPNSWPHLNHILIEGLRSTHEPVAEQLAFKLAKKWLETNYIIYIRSGRKMFEKYNALTLDEVGHGGEYDVQEGFGWTNGVVLDLLLSYGNVLEAPAVPM